MNSCQNINNNFFIFFDKSFSNNKPSFNHSVFYKKIKKKLQENSQGRFYIDSDKKYWNTIFLAGTGRSGTTWVSEIINYRNEYRYIFEPFHSKKLDICKNFRNRQYIRPNNIDNKFIEPANFILSGKIRNFYVDYRNRKFVSNKRLIKDIRANLFLRWIYENFPRIPIILMLRHPCSVASSKLKLNWRTHLKEFLSQDELLEDFLNPFRNEIDKANSVFEKHIYLWAIENYVPLKQFNKGEIHLAFYENFCVNPKDEIERLFSFLNKDFDEKALLKSKNPSLESKKFSAVVTGNNLIDNWKKHISEEQITKAIDILTIFGLDKIYTEDSMPNTENAYKLLGKN